MRYNSLPVAMGILVMAKLIFKMTSESEGYIFPYHPPAYISPPENWSTSGSPSPSASFIPTSRFPPYDASAKFQPPKIIGEKPSRLVEFDEENILPEDKVRKRVKSSLIEIFFKPLTNCHNKVPFYN